MWFFALFAAIAAAIFIEIRIYKKRGLADLTYTAYFGAEEVFEGDFVYLYEKIINNKSLPVPYLKVDTDLPEGLKFTLIEENMSDGKKKLKKVGRIQSMFVMKGGTQIERRWRVSCDRRGEYDLEGAIMIIKDILGLSMTTKRIEIEGGERQRLVVLPVPVELEEHYTSSNYMSGDVVSNHCMTTDPLRICGSREYTPYDPMNRINWKSSVAHGKLMVNVEEKTVRHSFGLILNMNSRGIEKRQDFLSDTESIERNISVCASILDRIAAEDVPVRLYMNTPADKELIELGMTNVSDDEVGRGVLVSPPLRGRYNVLTAMRILASVKMEISVAADRMFDHILEDPKLYRENEHLIIVSAYLDQRMLNLHSILKKEGVNVIFYITTARSDISDFPEDVEIYYKTY